MKLDHFKANAELVLVDFDSCEFKNGSFSHAVKDQNTELINWLPFASFRHNDMLQETVYRSYLIFRKNDTAETFVSDSFPFDMTTMKVYVLQEKVVLFVSRGDRKQYVFELKE